MATTTWSTQSVSAIERFEYWREVVCRAILDVATEAPPESGFQASISCRRFGALRFASFRSGRHQIVRGQSHIRQASEATYLVSLQRSGRSLIGQGEARFTVDPGEIAVIDSRRPFEVGFTEAVDRIVAVVPQSVLDPRAPWLRRRGAVKIEANAPFADLARRHLLQLAVGETALGEAEATLLTDNLCNLLALASRGELPDRAQPDAQLEGILAYARQNLFDPALSPKSVAAALGVPLRTLHARFERTGQTFGQWVLERRLDACRAALRDPAQAGDTIATIAFRLGFNDLSHFCRVFKQRYGVTAREWRGGTAEA